MVSGIDGRDACVMALEMQRRGRDDAVKVLERRSARACRHSDVYSAERAALFSNGTGRRKDDEDRLASVAQRAPDRQRGLSCRQLTRCRGSRGESMIAVSSRARLHLRIALSITADDVGRRKSAARRSEVRRLALVKSRRHELDLSGVHVAAYVDFKDFFAGSR